MSFPSIFSAFFLSFLEYFFWVSAVFSVWMTGIGFLQIFFSTIKWVRFVDLILVFFSLITKWNCFLFLFFSKLN